MSSVDPTPQPVKSDEGPSGRLTVKIVPVTAFRQNCCLLFDDAAKVGVVVDPGGSVPHILAAIETAGLKVEAIWLTHGHLDHAGGAMALQEHLAVPIIGPHKNDEPILSSIEIQAQKFGVGPGEMQNATPDRWLEDGDIVGFAGLEFEVLHCPGHSPGHVVYFQRALKFLHAGDVLFSGSIGRTDLPGGDHATLLASIREKILPLGDDVTFICGHGPGSTLGVERKTNPFLV